ncbi:MAG: type II secretion system protein GspJ, partial [Planctomyces sp.]
MMPRTVHAAAASPQASGRHRANAARPRRSAFTLVELIAASVIVAMIAGATTLVVSRAVRGRDASNTKFQAAARAPAGAARLARDAANVAREANAEYVRLLIAGTPDPIDGARSTITMLSQSMSAVRGVPSQNESSVHEVQYRIDRDEDGTGAVALWRRVDPNPDAYIDAGGVAEPVVPGIVGLRVEATDGQTWTTEWDSDAQGLPHAVRFTVTAVAGRAADVD